MYDTSAAVQDYLKNMNPEYEFADQPDKREEFKRQQRDKVFLKVLCDLRDQVARLATAAEAANTEYGE